MPYDASANKWATSAAVTSLTDSSGGTPSDTIADVPAAYNEANNANAVASLAGKVNAILAALRAAGLIAS